MTAARTSAVIGKIPGDFQSQEGHGQWSANDGDRKGTHTDHGVDYRCQRGMRKNEGRGVSEYLAEQRPHEQRREKQTAAKARADGHCRGRRFEQEDAKQRGNGCGMIEIEVQGTMTAGQHLRRNQCERTHDSSADRRTDR